MALEFDSRYYLQNNPDVAAAISRGLIASAEEHYNLYGRFESRNPSAFFNTSYYLAEYPDVAAAGVNPLTHFLTFGAAEGRFTNATVANIVDADGNGFANDFDSATYLAANPDVAANVGPGKAFATAYQHFIEFGQFESRSGAPAVGPFGNDGGTGGLTQALTTGIDALTGGANNDIFNAVESTTGFGGATFTAGDTINGGAGIDTLNITQSAAFTAVPAGATVSNVELVNVTSASSVAINTTGNFSGLTNLKTTSIGSNTVVTASGVAVSATATTGAISVNGGSTVTANSLANTNNAITIGNTTAPTGAVVVNSTGAATGATLGAINVTGGSTVTINETGGNNVNTTATGGAVTVTGNASTTAVTVNQSTVATAAAATAGFVAGAVTIADVNAASNTAASTIATVSLKNFGNSTINSGALTTVNLSGTGGTLGVTAGALTTPTVSALGLNTNGLTSGAITLDADYKTLNLTNSTAASTIASLTASGATAVNIAGDAALTLTAQSLAAALTITSTNTAGVTLGSQLGTGVAFTGGTGNDSIILGATTKAIAMGAGNDTVTATAALGTGGSVSGGDGIDRLITTGTILSSATEGAKYTGFEILQVTDGTVDATNISGITAIELNGSSVTVNNLTASQANAVSILGNGTYTLGLAGATTIGQLDALTVTVDDGLAAKNTITVGNLTAAGVETVNIVTNDNLTLSSATGLTGITKLMFTGAGDVNVTTGNLAINANTVVDASAHTGAFTFDASAATTNGLSITGSSTAVNTITGTAQNDVIVAGSANNILNGGAGDDIIRAGNGNNTIDGGAGADTITVGNGNNTITGGAGNDIITVGNGTNTITGGAGADTINLGTGANTLVHTTLTDSVATAFDTVNGFVAGLDKIDVTTAPTAILQGAAYTAAGTGALATDLASALTNGGGTLAANNAAYVTISSGTDAGTYLIINDGTSGFQSANDAVIKMVGLTGTLAVADFV